LIVFEALIKQRRCL